MTHTTTSSNAWWSARRRRYNVGLVIAGILAFIAYVTVGTTLLQPNAEFEVTIFTTIFQGVGYLFVMGMANICYCLGPLSEHVVQPRDPERYRHMCFGFGFWFSVLLPFSVPALLTILAFSPPS